MEKTAIIVAGGTGTRMNAGIPKQFLLLGGKPMLMHSIIAFIEAYPEISIILALPSDQFTAWKQLCEQHSFTIIHQVVAGGETRFQSVQNALKLIGDDGLVAIHDGARPMISVSLIRTTFITAVQLGNCIPVIPLNESVRQISGETNRSADRHAFRIVQTPQVFRSDVIKKAYSREFLESFTDDASVAESAGETIHLAEGDPLNIKITHPYDLAVAEMLLNSR